MDELHKVGPPMMQEIELNQNKITETHKQCNKIQGQDNYKLMLNLKRTTQDNKTDELDEYKAKYQHDLLARLQQKNQKQDMDRKNWMQKKQEYRAKVAASSPDGKQIKFVQPLHEMEQKDYDVAQRIHKERVA